MTITLTQAIILDALRSLGLFPHTIKRIAEEAKVALITARRNLKSLVKLGLVQEYKPRTIGRAHVSLYKAINQDRVHGHYVEIPT